LRKTHIGESSTIYKSTSSEQQQETLDANVTVSMIAENSAYHQLSKQQVFPP